MIVLSELNVVCLLIWVWEERTKTPPQSLRSVLKVKKEDFFFIFFNTSLIVDTNKKSDSTNRINFNVTFVWVFPLFSHSNGELIFLEQNQPRAFENWLIIQNF